MAELIKKDTIAVPGGLLEIRLYKEIYTDEDFLEDEYYPEYVCTIDNVQWFCTESEQHALVLFEILRNHVTEYMHYEMLDN